VKVSALTALTGADLANGDQFLVTDVGSPNVSKSITADQLAQGSQFSGRYVSQADQIRIDLQTCMTWNTSTGATASAVLRNDGDAMVLTFPKPTPTAQDTVVKLNSLYIPDSWTTGRVTLIYSIQAANTDEVVFRFSMASYNDAGSFTSGTLGSLTTVDLDGKTAYRYYGMDLGTFTTSGHEGSSRYTALNVSRVASNAADTSSATVCGHAIVISKDS